MLRTFINAWKVPDVRRKLLFTALIILIFRIGSGIPVPFVLAGTDLIGSDTNSFLSYLALFNGSAFSSGTLFALSISPYINSSIIMQLLTVAIPPLERLSKEGEEGRKKIASITRYVTVALAVLQATGYYFLLRNYDCVFETTSKFGTVFEAIVIVVALTAGAALIMWLGEQINDRGIGNGISIILFAGIISRIPRFLTNIYQYFQYGYSHGFVTGTQILFSVAAPILVICLLLMIAYIVFMDNAERRIPIQYAKRVVGRKMYGGQNTHIPIKVNMSGVMPIIFAGSILSLPTTIYQFIQNKIDDGSRWHTFFEFFSGTLHNGWGVLYIAVYLLLLVFFAYFYASIQYNPIEMANNIRKNSGAIPGIRPGKPTSDYLGKVIRRIVLLGVLMLAVVAIFPNVFSLITGAIETRLGSLAETQKVYQNGLSLTSMSLGGTSVIILVGVALETVQQLESQMMMRHYKGFLD